MSKFTLKDARDCLKALGEKGFDVHQVKEGMIVELEHSDITHGEPILTCRIALAHLRENPDYYKILKKVGL